MKNRVLIGVGANINPRKNIFLAKRYIFALKNVVFLGETDEMVTIPIGYINQPDFINCAFLVETSLMPKGLKSQLIFIEKRLGRKRERDKNRPRPIDLDILTWNRDIIDKDVYERYFLKQFVLELCPDIIL